METKSFEAKTWLNGTTPLIKKSKPPKKELPREFFAPNYLTPKWSGEGLFSKSALKIKNTMNLLHEDAILQFNNLCDSNRSLKLAVYNEFICYAKSKDPGHYELENFQDFWIQIKESKIVQYQILDEFIKIYCFKVISVYMYKIRFIAHLAEILQIPLAKNNFINPASFLNKLFQKGGSLELFCESLQSNPYSWYCPSSYLQDDLYKLQSNLSSISISQMMRVCTYMPSNIHFSHSLSHKEFGILLHRLLISLSKWLECDGGQRRSFLNCKFSGDHLVSLSLAHWLASQELQEKKETRICPVFLGEGFLEGYYFRICQELQLMSSLVKEAQNMQKNPREYLCKIMKEKYFSCFEDFNGQMPMFGQNEIRSEQAYGRVVINLTDLPPKNTYNFLINKINLQKKYLKKNGILYVFSNQKL
ncbi:MAG: hypothetical protein OXB84_00645, partial [Halobacteriovoraceae bacterium]|nr:hypothetical protein [Halobacteriovoraceae bacterium]